MKPSVVLAISVPECPSIEKKDHAEPCCRQQWRGNRFKGTIAFKSAFDCPNDAQHNGERQPMLTQQMQQPQLWIHEPTVTWHQTLCRCGQIAPRAIIFQMKLNDEQRRALQLLARHLDGCAEAVLLELGFSYDQLGEFVFNGFATMQAGTRYDDDGRKNRVVWVKITKAG